MTQSPPSSTIPLQWLSQKLGQAISIEDLEIQIRRRQITELACFGSILRDDFRPDSAIDLPISWSNQSRWTLVDFAQIHDDFAQLLHRPVDLVSKRAIQTSDNPHRRQTILTTAQRLYPQP